MFACNLHIAPHVLPQTLSDGVNTIVQYYFSQGSQIDWGTSSFKLLPKVLTIILNTILVLVIPTNMNLLYLFFYFSVCASFASFFLSSSIAVQYSDSI